MCDQAADKADLVGDRLLHARRLLRGRFGGVGDIQHIVRPGPDRVQRRRRGMRNLCVELRELRRQVAWIGGVNRRLAGLRPAIGIVGAARQVGFTAGR